MFLWPAVAVMPWKTLRAVSERGDLEPIRLTEHVEEFNRSSFPVEKLATTAQGSRIPNIENKTSEITQTCI